jgi:dienelactone hydrolase
MPSECRIQETRARSDFSNGPITPTALLEAIFMRMIYRLRWVLCALLVLVGAAGLKGMIWYRNFYNHVTPQEVSHEVGHSVFETTIRGDHQFKLELYQQANAKAQHLVIFSSGDGGWSPFCADVAAHIAAAGNTVVGFNLKEYLTTFATSQKPVTPEELTKDYGELIDAARSRAGVDPNAPVTLAGWSIGAGYSVLAGSNDNLKQRCSRVVAISLPNFNELAWKPTDAIIYLTHGTPREKVFEAKNYLPKLAPLPLVMLNATDDDTSPIEDAQQLFKRATGPRVFFAVNAKGHHFEGGEGEFYRDLDEGLSKQQL